MKGDDIATRLRGLAVGVIRLCRTMPDDVAAKRVSRQLVRAATGAGANYEEARGAESRADFVHKLGIANKELREALYWLQLTREATLLVDDELERLAREAYELVAILTASINTTKRGVATVSGEQEPRARTSSSTGTRSA